MNCKVYYNGSFGTPTPNKMTFFDALYFDYKIAEENNSSRINLFIHPKEKITLSKVVIEIPYNFLSEDQVFCNGFQSWSHSKTYGIGDNIPQIRGLAKRYFQYYGDDHLILGKKPALYSWTYGYVQSDSQFFFVGSTSESTAYTFIEYDIGSNLIRLTKLCDDIELSHSFPVLDIVVNQGNEKAVFDIYFESMSKSNKQMDTTFGWTSWYRHYNDISEAKIEEDLQNFSSLSDISPLNDHKRIFQIDDGYQNAIGDWIEPSTHFPKGLSHIANKITAQNIVPGIWIAPFVCSKDSKIFAQKKDWLLKDTSGRVIKAGYNPLWGGWYYALDIYNAQVRDYLTEVFYTFINKWGFELIKADFLFAAILSPPKDKTKAQVMFDAMSLLEQLIGQKQLLACGVPLGSAFQKTAYCRIGPDTHLAWDHKLLKFIRKRERVSTINALRTIIHRRHLNKKVFVNDPDVFIMRSEGHKLNLNQQYTTLLIQVLFGSQIFNSDDWKQYNEDTIEEIKGLVYFIDSKILKVQEPEIDYYQVSFMKEKNFIAHINLNNNKVKILGLNDSFDLKPFESIVLMEK